MTRCLASPGRWQPHIARELHYVVLQDLVLATQRAQHALVERKDRASPERRVELTIEEDFPEQLSQEKKKNLLPVVREALASARRHSGARRVRVHLWATEDEIRVEVSDHGEGLDPQEVRGGAEIGSMEERAALGGELEIMSSPGRSTTVRLHAPRSF